MRKPHYLKRHKTNSSIHDCVWVDTETSPDIKPNGDQHHYLDFGWSSAARQTSPGEWTDPDWCRFETKDHWYDFLYSRLHGKCKLYVFAHNWAFDAPVLDVFNRLPQDGWILKGAVIQSPPIILRFKRGAQSIIFIDTLNIWRMSLKRLGDSIGLPKLEMPPKTASKEKWDSYGKRDTEIIMMAVVNWLEFLRVNDLGGFCSTAASQAMRTFRHRFMKHEIMIDANEPALALARNALHGGRTECDFIGKVPERVYKLDINSQYPAEMISQFMPTKIVGRYKNVSIEEAKELLTKFCLVAECEVISREPVFPVVMNDSLMFPVGKFTTYLSTPEIQYGLKHGLIRKIKEVAIYQKAKIFKDYIEYFYKLRLEYKKQGNKVGDQMVKLLMNSLYGKFAQKGTIFKKIDDTNSDEIKVWVEADYETKEKVRYRQYARIVEELETLTESRSSHPAIAAHITAHGRMKLWNLMQLAGKGNYFYKDTDSLWTNKKGYANLKHLLDDTKLGYLKLEGIHKDVELYGPKDYCIDGESRIKGVRANAEEIVPGVFLQDKFSSLKGLLRVGDLTAPIITQKTKKQYRQYRKGIVNEDGTVSPFRIST